MRQCPAHAHATIAAAHAGDLVTGGVRSLEVRWIFPGRPDPAVTAWFRRFPAWAEAREDTYLVCPEARGLSVKIRGGQALEVKAYRGSPGNLEVARRARGRMESWQKWSAAHAPSREDDGDPACWKAVGKARRIAQFHLAGGQSVPGAPEGGHGPRCHLELTMIRMQGQDWWSLGFEATGPAGLHRAVLEATAGRVFDQALPGGLQPGPDDARSYAEWLGQRPGPDRDA
jgi:hypothetical protein